jgi:long-chain-fatty-acid--CoA ligase ACSBG
MEFRVVNPSKAVKILRDVNDNDEPVTIQQMFNEVVANHGDRMALMRKDKISGEWSGITYKQYREKVEKIAKVFIKLGLERHGAVAILASNCMEWFVADLAAVFAGQVTNNRELFNEIN